MTLDLALRLRVHAARRGGSASTSGRRGRRHRRRPLAARPGRRRPADGRRRPPTSLAAAEDELGDVEHAALAVPGRAPAAVVGRPGDPRGDRALHARRAGRRAVVPVEHRVHPPHQRPRLVDDVHRIVFDASYLVLGLGDVYLGAPVATPLDPRHRLVTTKYNPARTWTPENAVGIGGAYLCIYGMEGPGRLPVRRPHRAGVEPRPPRARTSTGRGCCAPSTSSGSTRSTPRSCSTSGPRRRAGELDDRDRGRRRSGSPSTARSSPTHAAEIDAFRAAPAGRVRRRAAGVGSEPASSGTAS